MAHSTSGTKISFDSIMCGNPQEHIYFALEIVSNQENLDIEIIGSNKIFSCLTCLKNFSTKRRMEKHETKKTCKSRRSGFSLLKNDN